ncbi:MAG: hypothetical protein IKC26_01910 [Clostridia bacterium]|nr:hypothetical protein [Clostridia bacterium]
MLIYYADALLALGLLIGIVLMCVGSARHSLGLQVCGGTIAALCIVVQIYLMWG